MEETDAEYGWQRCRRTHLVLDVVLRLSPNRPGLPKIRVIQSGFHAVWITSQSRELGVFGPAALSAPLTFESQASVAPGSEVAAQIHPMQPELWGEIAAGDELVLVREGSLKPMGVATVSAVRPEA